MIERPAVGEAPAENFADFVDFAHGAESVGELRSGRFIDRQGRQTGEQLAFAAGQFQVRRQEHAGWEGTPNGALENAGFVVAVEFVERLPVRGEEADEFAAFVGNFKLPAVEVGRFEAGPAEIVERAGEPLGERPGWLEAAEVMAVELAEEAGGQNRSAERSEQLPAGGGEVGAGQFEGQGGDGVEPDVDDGLTGAGEAFEPLLADATRGTEQPFFGEWFAPAGGGESGQEGVFAWRRRGKVVSRRHC